MNRTLRFLAALCVAASAYSATVTVRLNTAIGGVIEARHDATVMTAPVTAGVANLTLDRGVWYLRLGAAGYWSEEKVVVVDRDAVDVGLTAFPAATITAPVVFPKEISDHTIVLHFESAEIHGSAQCRTTANKTHCELPALKSDLVFRVAGCASIYRWDIDPAKQKTLEPLVFKRGATISGLVDSGERKIDPNEITVTLEPRMTTHPNKRGFFSFDAEPGVHRLYASANGLITEPRDVRVIDGKESYLEQPLRLEPPRKLTINITPPADPWEKPWQVSLTPIVDGASGNPRKPSSHNDGAYQFEQLPAGLYQLNVDRGTGETWHAEIIPLSEDLVMPVTVPIVHVAGAVLLGDRPIPSRMTFRHQALRVSAGTNPEGRFKIALPVVEGNVWDSVAVVSAVNNIHRTFEHVTITPPSDPASMARLELHLPTASFGGEIVDESGRPAFPALVNITSPDGDFQQIESTDGTFVLSGAAPGRYLVRAQTQEADTERATEVQVKDESDASQYVRLVVKPRMYVEGFVRSSFGAVPGASVFAAPVFNEGGTVFTVNADADGHFRFPLPPRTRELILSVAAPGFAYRLMRLTPGTDPINIRVEQLGGTLAVDSALKKDGMRPYVLHDGAALTAWAFAYLANAKLTADPAERLRFEVDDVAPGEYSLCWLASIEEAVAPPAGRCVSGFVVPQAHLALRFAANESAPQALAARP